MVVCSLRDIENIEAKRKSDDHRQITNQTLDYSGDTISMEENETHSQVYDETFQQKHHVQIEPFR